MRRARRAESFTGYGGLKLVEVPRPRGGNGRVLVRVTAAGVTPLDHTMLSGNYPPATTPLIFENDYLFICKIRSHLVDRRTQHETHPQSKGTEEEPWRLI